RGGAQLLRWHGQEPGVARARPLAQERRDKGRGHRGHRGRRAAMSDLKEELDRALRTVTVGEAPVERAKRAGRRIRARRRVTLLAGVLAVAAVAAGYPALAGSAAAPPAPLTGHPAQAPSPRPSDMAVRAGPAPATTQAPGGLASKTGEIAAGSVGDMGWRVAVVPPGQKNPVPADSCYTITIVVGGDIQGPCYDLPAALG